MKLTGNGSIDNEWDKLTVGAKMNAILNEGYPNDIMAIPPEDDIM